MNDHGDIDLAIGDIVIEGVDGITGEEVEQALRQELVRLLSSPNGISRQALSRNVAGGPSTERGAPSEIRMSPGDSSSTLGHGLAQTIYGALRQS